MSQITMMESLTIMMMQNFIIYLVNRRVGHLLVNSRSVQFLNLFWQWQVMTWTFRKPSNKMAQMSPLSWTSSSGEVKLKRAY